MADDDITFRSSALDVVSSWLTGGPSTANSDGKDQDNGNELKYAHKAPVLLYHPNAASTANHSSKEPILSKEEQEMKKKLLRKIGTMRTRLEEENELSIDAQHDDDDEEEQLVQYKRKTAIATGNSAESVTDRSKKRKSNAQDELLVSLRDEAERKKVKNAKAKLRMQRKKAAAATDSKAVE